MDMTNFQKLLEELGAKPSISEENGLSQIESSDLRVLSVGISSGGFAEIRMAWDSPDRKIVATTIDEEGLKFAEKIISTANVSNQIELRLEDIRNDLDYPAKHFDFIYARLVLHYLPSEELDQSLKSLYRVLKKNKKIFVVVRSDRNLERYQRYSFDTETKLTTIPRFNSQGSIVSNHIRYFHTEDSIKHHLEENGFKIIYTKTYWEQLYRDFERKEISPHKDHVIELLAEK